VPYPDEGQPNLRPGWDSIPLAKASRFDPNMLVDELWEDFCAGSASLIELARALALGAALEIGDVVDEVLLGQ
jgi:hypothetical protein